MKTTAIQVESVFDRFFALSNFCICVIDKNCCITRLNPFFEEYTGYPADHYLGKPLNDLAPAEHRIFEAVTSLADSIHIGETPVNCHDGAVKWLDIDAFFHDEHWYLNGCDITNQKLAEQEAQRAIDQYKQFTDFAREGLALYQSRVSREISYAENMIEQMRESRLKLSKTLQNAKLGSWEYSFDTRKIELSDEAFPMLGLFDKVFSIRHFKELCHPDDWELVKSSFGELRKGNAIGMDIRLKINKKLKYFNLQGYPYTLYNEVHKVTGTLQDITPRKMQERDLLKAKETAEKATQVKDLFLANISHELRTPLNSILGFAELLARKPGTPKLREYVESIRTSGNNLLFIINELLDLSKLQADAIKLDQMPFNLKDCVDYTERLFAPAVRKTGIELKCSIDPEVPLHLVGDPYRLNQILTNVMGNAIKFTQQGSVNLRIKLLRSLQKKVVLQLVVADTGIGIPREILGKIFQNFSQGTPEISRKYGGTGLGLSIVKHLVTLFDGEISVNSQVGKGSIFSISLTFLRGKENLEQKIQADQEENPEDLPAGIRILVAEDHEINQILIEEMFTDYNCHISIVPDGQQAIRLLEQETFDLVLMDLQMPVMDGYETTAHIRKSNKAYHNIPIIALTGDAMRGEMEKCLAAGMNDYISKPFEFKRLVEKIKLNVVKNDR